MQGVHETSPRAFQLVPRVHAACAVCAAAESTPVASAAQIEAQLRYLRLFHGRRVRGQRDGRTLEERADFTHDYATAVVECIRCGLVYRDPRPDTAAIARAYAKDEYGEERLEALFDSQLELFRPKADAVRQQLTRSAAPTVIEIGSFVGGFLAAMREQGARAVGVDPGEEVVGFCRAKGLDVVRGSVEDDQLANGAADCVAVWNTFDQLPQPQETLIAIRRLLRPGGLLVIRVPNGALFRRAAVWLRQGPKAMRPWLSAALAWNNLLAFPYLHGYSLASLDRLLASHSFERVAFQPDVLTRLADARTKRWAALEEKMLKGACRLAVRLDRSGSPRGAEIAPWFDAYYRMRPTLRLVR
jgi:SAM-dependent methyltransferase